MFTVWMLGQSSITHPNPRGAHHVLDYLAEGVLGRDVVKASGLYPNVE